MLYRTNMYLFLYVHPEGLCSLLSSFHLFGSKIGFSRTLDSLYGAFWRCPRVRL